MKEFLKEILKCRETSEIPEKLLDMFSELVPTDKRNVEKMNREKEILTAIVK